MAERVFLTLFALGYMVIMLEYAEPAVFRGGFVLGGVLLLASYLVGYRDYRPTLGGAGLGVKGPGEMVGKPPVMPFAPKATLALRLKQKADREA